MTNKELVQEIIDNLTNDSENPGRMLPHLTDDCKWILYPGGTEYHGKAMIQKFITTAMASRGGKPSDSPSAKVDVTNWFTQDDHLCIEYQHTFSFGNNIPIFNNKVRDIMVKHCNIYSLQKGKISEVHEYTSSSRWWLNLAMQLALGSVKRKSVKR